MRSVAAGKGLFKSPSFQKPVSPPKSFIRHLIKQLQNHWSGLLLSGLSQFDFCENRQVASGDRVNMPQSSKDRLFLRAPKGFSLVELLAVIAIIAIMLALLAPAIGSFSSTAGRKGAINIVMNTLEQARAAALEQNCSVNVLFWRRNYPDRDAIMVVRDPSPWIFDDKGNPETNLVPLTRWIPLPDKILLHKAKGQNIFNNQASNVIAPAELHKLPSAGGSLPEDEYLAVLKFNSSGSVVSPSLSADARIVITEGVRGEGGTEAILAQRKQGQATAGGGFDIITLSRFTGRPRLDVSTL
jgi:prepilin-type N-terminal cleavage/methylation domain-containing protein